MRQLAITAAGPDKPSQPRPRKVATKKSSDPSNNNFAPLAEEDDSDADDPDFDDLPGLQSDSDSESDDDSDDFEVVSNSEVS